MVMFKCVKNYQVERTKLRVNGKCYRMPYLVQFEKSFNYYFPKKELATQTESFPLLGMLKERHK